MEKVISKSDTKSVTHRRDPFSIFMAIVCFILMAGEFTLLINETGLTECAGDEFGFLMCIGVGMYFLERGIGSERVEKD